MRIGYKLCSEERTALQLVDDARRAEAAGLSFAAISDHFHPWIEAQGQSPFVWPVIGAVANATSTLEVGTARHLPNDPDAPGDRGAGCRDGRDAAPRPLLPRPRDGGEPQRARRRPRLAQCRYAPAHAARS